jgi:hypothetical protein
VQGEDFTVKTFKTKNNVSQTGTTASQCAITQPCRPPCTAPGNARHTASQFVTIHRHFEGKFRNKTKIFQDEVWYSVPNLHPSRLLHPAKLFYKKYIFLLTVLNLLIVAPRGSN